MAFGKLHGLLPSKPLSLPGKNALNIGMAAGSVAAGAQFLTTGDPAAGLAALGATTALGGAMGAHMTASIGGADMPVVRSQPVSCMLTVHRWELAKLLCRANRVSWMQVITLLNSYSGYALAAEGFMLQNDLLTTVGALVGQELSCATSTFHFQSEMLLFYS